MASEIRVNKINSRTGVGTITLSPTGVDFTGIATVATLKATTGIVTTLSATGNATVGGTLNVTGETTFATHINLGDNDKAIFGAGDDLQIYHDGSNSYIDDTGTGRLNIRGNTGVSLRNYSNSNQFINCYTDGTVELFYNNSKKFETTDAGASVTGAFNVGSGTSITSSSLIVNDVQYPTAGALSNRNLIINGAMKVAQRGTSVTGVGVDDYTCCDRFKHFASVSGQAGRLTATQENITDLAGFNKALKLQVTTSETPGSTESYGLNTRLEHQDVKKLDIGTSAAVPLTLSFYAKAPTGNGVFCAGIIMPGGGSYIEEVTIGTSWSRHEINIPATTNSVHASTQTNDTHNGMEVQITLMAGSSRNDHGNGTWEADTDNRATSNQSNFFSSTSNNLFITGVQLERGEKATPFEHRSYGDDLAKCHRYYYRAVDGSRDSYHAIMSGSWYITTQLYGTIHFPTEMRAIPTLSYSSNSNTSAFKAFGAAVSSTTDDIATQQEGTTIYSIYLYNLSPARTSGYGGWAELNNESGAYIAFSSEL